MRSAEYPSSASTASVCWPQSGAGPATPPDRENATMGVHRG